MASRAYPDHEHARQRAYTADDETAAPRLADKARPAPATAHDPGAIPVSVTLDGAAEGGRRGPMDPPDLVSDRHWARRQSAGTILIGFVVLLAAVGWLIWLGA